MPRITRWNDAYGHELSAYLKGPWFDYLLVSPTEMKDILVGTAWRLRKILRGEGPVYVAILTKDARRGAGSGDGARTPPLAE